LQAWSSGRFEYIPLLFVPSTDEQILMRRHFEPFSTASPLSASLSPGSFREPALFSTPVLEL
jgi:hypothetical protein